MTQAIYPSRRRLVRSSLAGGLALLARNANASPIPAAPPLRFVHLTDVHACATPRAAAGFARALDSIARLRPAADFILTGGDHVMDTFSAATPATAHALWDLYDQTLAAHNRLPVRPVLGNHDVFGWGAHLPAGNRPADYGKALALDRLKLDGPYYSFDQGGWHFICLDNVAQRPDGNGYYGALDPAQLEWLKADLQSTGRRTPICITTHIPLLSACVFFDPGTSRAAGYAVRDSDMHRDVQSLLALLRPDDAPPYNVRLCLSGHIHLLDRIEYRGITFICGGAVCGNWWQGAWQGCEPGYGVVDLWPDGSFHHQYVPYANPAAAEQAAASARLDVNVLSASR